MLIDGMELKDYAEKRKKEFKREMENCNNNIKRIARDVRKVQVKYEIPYTEVGMVAGVSPDTVSEFLRGKTTPHLFTACAIAKAVGKLKKIYEEQKKNDNNAKTAE